MPANQEFTSWIQSIVDQGGAVDAQELCRVETAFQFGNGLIDTVRMAVNYGIRELVLSHKVRHGVEFQKRDALADARCNAARITRLLSAEGCG